MQSTNDLLLWLTSAGGATAVVSFALSFVGRFTDLPERTQFLIRTALMIAIALGARFALDTIPAETKTLIEPYVATLGVLLGGVFVQHQAAKKGNDTNERNIRSRAIKRGAPFERPTKF